MLAKGRSVVMRKPEWPSNSHRSPLVRFGVFPLGWTGSHPQTESTAFLMTPPRLLSTGPSLSRGTVRACHPQTHDTPHPKRRSDLYWRRSVSAAVESIVWGCFLIGRQVVTVSWPDPLRPRGSGRERSPFCCFCPTCPGSGCQVGPQERPDFPVRVQPVQPVQPKIKNGRIQRRALLCKTAQRRSSASTFIT